MVNCIRFLYGFILLEVSIISVAVGLHNHHPRPPPPQPPQRLRPPPPRPPPPNPPRTTTPKPTTTTATTTTPAPEVEVELEEISTLAPNSTTVAPSTVKQPAAHYHQGGYPYNYYNQYYHNSGQPSSQTQHSQPYNYNQNYNSQPYDQNQNYNRQPYDQNQYYNQAQGYNSGYYSGQSYVAGPGQNQPAYNYVTGAPHPTTYPYHQNHPPNNPYSATQPPPAAHAPYVQPQQHPAAHAPQPNSYPQYDHYAASPPTPTSATHYYPPDQRSNHQQHQQPNPAQPQPDYYSQQNQYQQSNNQQPPPAQPLTQADYHSQQSRYQQTSNQQPDPAYQPGPAGPPKRPKGQNPPQRLPTPPANSLPPQPSSGRRQTQSVNSRPVLDEKYQTRYERPRSYKADGNLPSAPIPLPESRSNGIVDNRPIAQSPDVRYNEVARDTQIDRRPSVQSQDVRYNEVVRDSQVNRRPVEKSPDVRYVEPRSDIVYVKTLDRRQPEAPTAESRYYQAEQRPADSISYRSAADIPRRSEIRTDISRQAADYGIGTETIASESRYLQKSEGKPPGNIAYLKPLDAPSATVKAEYNYMKESEKRQRLPTENQLLEIKRQQLELLKLLQREKEKSSKRQNPYFKALFENKTPELNKEKIPKTKDQCPLYKYTVEKDRIEIHTEPGRCKIVIKLPKDGSGKPKVTYLSRN